MITTTRTVLKGQTTVYTSRPVTYTYTTTAAPPDVTVTVTDPRTLTLPLPSTTQLPSTATITRPAFPTRYAICKQDSGNCTYRPKKKEKKATTSSATDPEGEKVVVSDEMYPFTDSCTPSACVPQTPTNFPSAGPSR